LLRYLREKFGDCHYEDPPVALAPGNETTIYAFRLKGLAPPLDRPLILRLFRSGTPRRAVLTETVVQNAVAAQGFPAAPAHSICADTSVLGAPFFVMERLPGRPLYGESLELDRSGRPSVGLAGVLRDGVRMLTEQPQTLARVDARIHSLDSSAVIDALERAGLDWSGMTVEGQICEMSQRTSTWGLDGLVAAIEWLRANLPAEPDKPVVCHGDMQPLNLLVRDGEICGVVDWSNTLLAARECEIGWTRATLLTIPVPLPGPLRYARRVFMALIARRYSNAYRHEHPLDANAVSYHEAFHSLLMLTHIGEEISKGHVFRSAWNTPGGVANLIAHFRTISGVTPTIPPLPPSIS
jgi:aminoglycoside phosphotransferase (APT) family kinase protein